jgi:serine/threonine protein kinase
LLGKRQPDDDTLGNHSLPGPSTFGDGLDTVIRNGRLEGPTRLGNLGGLDHFEIRRLIGAGGMGMVLLARDTRDGSEVAIKLPKAGLEDYPVALQRFLGEARHMQKLVHPHIIRVLEIHEDSQRPYFVMPYFRCGSLSQLIKRGKPLEPGQVLKVGRQIAEALVFAHRKGIIHCDLKPANVLLNAEGEACLTDFGLARSVLNDPWTMVDGGKETGTAPYMSPAIAAGEVEDTRCDIYSFGALLYEMLTGQPPYVGKDAKEIINQVRQGPPRPLREVQPLAPAGLALIAETAMSRELRDRYANMSDVLADLDRVAKDQNPVGAHDSTTISGLRSKWKLTQAGRRRLSLGAGLVIALVLAVFLWRELTPHFVVLETIQTAKVPHWGGALVTDWDGDQKPDLCLAQEDRWWVRSFTGQMLGPFNVDAPRTTSLRLRSMYDVNGDGLSEAFLAWCNGPDSYLSVVNQNQYELQRFHVQGSRYEGPLYQRTHTAISPARWLPASSNMPPQLLVLAKAVWSLNPRGLYSFALSNAEPQWQHLIAPYPTAVEMVDLDHDGQAEIVLGSSATGNTNRLADGTDDDHCYLYALTRNGALLWRRELEGPLSECWPVESKAGNPSGRVIVAVSASS